MVIMQKKMLHLLAFSIFYINLSAQSSIKGILLTEEREAVMFANIALFEKKTNQLTKVEISNEEGEFTFKEIAKGNYLLKVTYVGFEDLSQEITLKDQETRDLGELILSTSSIQLEGAEITAQRALVETKADRTVFNVQGTINSAGDSGINLLRKAPGVLVDNNNNISVMGRSGVLIYVNGKRMPFSGEDLTNYLQNLTSEQIDRIDIITNPSAKYEAEGNAGIIDIILKKDDTKGLNGSISTQYSKGIAQRTGVNFSGNYRNNGFNIFGNLGFLGGNRYNRIDFFNYQNGLVMNELDLMNNSGKNYSYQFGTDYFINKYNTIGFMVDGNINNNKGKTINNLSIASQATPTTIDSLLLANNESNSASFQSLYNMNYQFRKNETNFNVDLDYGSYSQDNDYLQPNRYYTADTSTLLSENLTSYLTPSKISIYTAKADFDKKISNGKLGLGSKFTKVVSDNTYKFFNHYSSEKKLNLERSNDFLYDENVLAGDIDYRMNVNSKWSISTGLRTEYTQITGTLKAYRFDLQEDPVKLNYVKFFPSVGISYSPSRMHSFNLNYGKRINRPDYNVLNPFLIKMSELSSSRGNAELKPEVVHNIDLSYTVFYMYTLKLGYSKTYDQITRFLGADENDPRAGFITWDNLSEQTILSANLSLPIKIKKWWNAYVNLSVSNQDNKADLGENKKVDLNVTTFNLYQQQTFTLPRGFKAEVSGWYSSPGIWGGVFLFDPSWSLNLGLQRKFFNDKLLVKVSAQDIFKEAGWSGVSNYGGLEGRGMGDWDSRRFSVSLNYNFGSNKIKKARNRKTGIEEEKKRTGGGNKNSGR